MKSTNAQILERVKEVVNLLIKGDSREDILQYSAENWKVKERQTDSYIKKAKKHIEEKVGKEIEYTFGLTLIRLNQLYKKSTEKKDYKTALAIQKELALLHNLYNNKIEENENFKFINNVPD